MSNDYLQIFIVCGLAIGIPLAIWIWSEMGKRARERERVAAIMAKQSVWGAALCQSLIQREVGPDMTQEMVILAWGRPNRVDDHEVTKKGTKERWVYGVPRRGANYVWFTDGKVTKVKT